MSEVQVIPDGDDLIRCPYNRSHHVRVRRMPYHLIKCRKNHQGVQYSRCVYNANHLFRETEIRRHLEVCPDRSFIDEYD